MYLKICGVTDEQEIQQLSILPVNLVGLWFGVPQGRSNLSARRWHQLVMATVASGAHLEPVLVTLLADARSIVEMLDSTGCRWVQLHGYQTPGMVGAIRASVPDATIVKVLHLIGDGCPEARFIRAYERAGVDFFLIDNALSSGQVGSTGLPVSVVGLKAIIRTVTRPFLLAGGIRAGFRRKYGSLLADGRWQGIDVDTGARTADGRLDSGTIIAMLHDLSDRRVGDVA